MRHLVCLFTLTLVACGGKDPGMSSQTDHCSSNEDCYAGCFGYDTAVCSVDGTCFCNDIHLDRGCDLDEECVAACDGYDSHSCSGGVCYCVDEAPALQCEQDSDCSVRCSGYDRFDCVDGVCYCFEEQDRECPSAARDFLIQELYVRMELDCWQTSCFDVGEYPATCAWGALEHEGIINIAVNCRPNDLLNRAEAVKIVISAIDGLAGYEAPTTPTFNDVGVETWFFDYIETAVQLGIVSGYLDDADNPTGYFGPGDVASTCWTMKILERVFPREPVDPDIDIVLSLNTNTAPSSTLPKGATQVHLATFDLTTTGPAVVLNNLTIRRGGVGSHNDWERIYIHDANGRSMGYGAIVPSDNVSTMPFGYTLYHDRTTTIHLLGDLSETAGASNQHYFYLSAGDLYSIGNVVGGDFPVAGNTMTVGGVTVNTVTISAGSALPDPAVDQDNVDVASILLSAGAGNDVALHKINLIQGGSLDIIWNLDSNTLKLYDGGVLLASGIDEANIYEGGMQFWLPAPFVVPAGETREITVVADIIGGLAGETIALFLFDYYTDAILVIDQQYGFGAQVDNQLGSADVTPLTLQ